MASNSQHRCVFVGNIPYDATEEQLVQICEEVGPVVSFRLVLDRETGKPKGYGFCEYKDEETALSARRNLQGYEINGRQLRVDFAENDKNADRNREQVKGRGGPGLMSNTDVQKASDAGVIPISHPLGFQVAETAASVMAGHLGGGQSSLPSLYGQSGLRNDPLTQYLATMSRNQLLEVMAEMKALVTQNKALAQQLLQSNSQFLKALFQAQLMLGMVTPQMMSHIQRSSDLGLQHQGFDAGQTPTLLPHNGPAPMLLNAPMIGSVGAVSRAQEVTSNLINTPLITHPTGLTHHIPVQSQYGIPQVPPLFQPQDTLASTSTGQAEKLAPGTSIGAQTLYPPVVSAQVPISVQPPILLQPGHVSEKILSQRPFSATGSQQQLLPQHPTSQFSAEVETALLQQVMSLTPEQLTSLPAEQRQQVILLQQMLQS